MRQKKAVRNHEGDGTSKSKGYIGIGMEGWIARWYAKTTEKDMAEFRNLADRLAKKTPPLSRILEIAPGPGYLSIELAKLGYRITGLDISESFVEIARERARRESVSVDFQHGNASAMPFDDATFDLTICRAAFKNFSEPGRALNEMWRVLKPGGRAIIVDLRKDVSPTEIAAYVEKLGLGWFDALFTKMTFRFMLIPRAYTKDQVAGMASESKFGTCEIAGAPAGMEILLRK